MGGISGIELPLKQEEANCKAWPLESSARCTDWPLLASAQEMGPGALHYRTSAGSAHVSVHQHCVHRHASTARWLLAAVSVMVVSL
jgi:hypothetical protein